MPLDSASLLQWQARRAAAAADRASRVQVFTMAGKQIGLAGVGSGEDVLTFPACFVVADALRPPHWLRYAEAGDEEPWIAGKFVRLEFEPATLIHSNGEAAGPEDCMGMWGVTMTGTAQKWVETYEDIPLKDLTGVTTPPTPKLESKGRAMSGA